MVVVSWWSFRPLSFVVFPAGPSDAEELARIHVASWRETYRGLLPDAFLARMSEPGFARRFRRSLSAAGAGVTLAAADRYGLVGYAQGGPSRWKTAGEAEIATLYVLRQAQGHGLGARLMTETARALAAQGAASLRVSVLRDNIRARGFYEHLGGEPEAARQEPGPGGRLLYEVAYRWPDIGTLIA
ncbi:GNAT family N-acetyltransferase [Phenylobacterium sp.]|jgi:ribosomal protein S18 acetylase RimI-like enzyme|uniref:GNAT family N-acetyltransferase n=1 Tax=Phenylobacterium sp. TaxID=1871053 RepID=UPI002E359FD1|nr:GNAT family N-acetyltransferase [Phenylobacterium sp.]HEX4712320.1 GNAT family N-acetyltransferase [Phenylobacterium sp.]